MILWLAMAAIALLTIAYGMKILDVAVAALFVFGATVGNVLTYTGRPFPSDDLAHPGPVWFWSARSWRRFAQGWLFWTAGLATAMLFYLFANVFPGHGDHPWEQTVRTACLWLWVAMMPPGLWMWAFGWPKSLIPPQIRQWREPEPHPKSSQAPWYMSDATDRDKHAGES
jgi:hypothetical protein